MKAYFARGIGGVVAVLGALLPVSAHAQMWSAASTTDALTIAYTAIGVVLLAAITALLAAWAGLVGLGFGKRKATKYVTGKKF